MVAERQKRSLGHGRRRPCEVEEEEGEGGGEGEEEAAKGEEARLSAPPGLEAYGVNSRDCRTETDRGEIM